MEALQVSSQNDHIGTNTCEDSSVTENDLSKDGLVVSEEEYWEKYYNDPDHVYEWHNGCLEVRPMSDVKGSEAYQWFCDIIRCYVRTYPVARIINLEIGFRMALPGQTNVRIPDLAVVLKDNPVMISDDDCRYFGTFDLCVESLSHSSIGEITRDTVVKKKEYEGAGVREYYILDARGIETVFYGLGPQGGYERISPVRGDVIRSAVLPGFRFRISDLYRQPSLEELAEDQVYCKYVLPSYRVFRQRAEKAEKEAEDARKRAERLAEKLRALGIDPDEIVEA